MVIPRGDHFGGVEPHKNGAQGALRVAIHASDAVAKRHKTTNHRHATGTPRERDSALSRHLRPYPGQQPPRVLILERGPGWATNLSATLKVTLNTLFEKSVLPNLGQIHRGD